MISLPAGFDYLGLFTSMIDCAIPFVGIAALMTAYRCLKRASKVL